MRATQVIRAALARRFRPSYGMDGGTGWEGFVDLRAHDEQYHGGNYVEGVSHCKLRDSMEQAPALLAQVGITLPNHDAMQRSFAEARETGLLDEQTAEEIAAIENEIRQRLNDLDSGNVDLQSIGAVAQELNSVYQAIGDAMAAREDSHEAPPAAERNEPQDIRQQEETPQQPLEEPPAPRANEMQGGAIELPQFATPPANYRMPPLNRLRPEQVTGQYLSKLAGSLPRRYRWELRRSGDFRTAEDAVRGILADPYTNFNAVERIQSMRDGPFKKRFLKTLDVLHPAYREMMEERARAVSDCLERVAENPGSPISDEDKDKIRIAFGNIGLRPYADTYISSMGAGSEPVDASYAAPLLRVASSSHIQKSEIAKAAIRALNAVHPEAKILTEEEVASYVPPVPEEVKAHDSSLGTEYGVLRTSGERPEFHGVMGHCNCWVNDNCMTLGWRGFYAVPIEDGGSSHGEWFGNCKMEMAKHYQKVNQDSPQATLQWLKDHDHEIPDGSAISGWSGGHNRSYHKVGGRWYQYDGFYRSYGEMVNLSTVAGQCWSHPVDCEIGEGSHYAGDNEQKKRIFGLMAKRELMAERRAAGQSTSDIPQTEIDARAHKLYHDSQSSYLILPTQPLIPQMFRCARSSPRHYGA